MLQTLLARFRFAQCCHAFCFGCVIRHGSLLCPAIGSDRAAAVPLRTWQANSVRRINTGLLDLQRSSHIFAPQPPTSPHPLQATGCPLLCSPALSLGRRAVMFFCALALLASPPSNSFQQSSAQSKKPRQPWLRSCRLLFNS